MQTPTPRRGDPELKFTPLPPSPVSSASSSPHVKAGEDYGHEQQVIGIGATRSCGVQMTEGLGVQDPAW